MRSIAAITVLVVLMISSASPVAARCGDWPAEDLVFCEDFDQYCTANNPTNPWPGYPPTPDTACPTSGATPDNEFFLSPMHWPSSCSDTMTVGTNSWGLESPPFFGRYGGGGTTAQYQRWDLGATIRSRHPGYGAVNGTDEHPLYVRFYFGDNLVGSPPNSPLYLELAMDDDRAPTDYVPMDCMDEYDCNCAPANPDATCEPGICEDVCVSGPNIGMVCWSNTDCGGCVGGAVPGSSCTTDFHCQAPCSTGQQATCQGGPNDGTACSQDSECSVGPVYPIVAQQRDNASIAVPHPPLSTATRKSVAFGQLAQTDPNPCNPETGKKPTQYHACTFDGLKWWDLRSNMFPGNGGDFNNDGRSAVYQMWIKTDSYTVWLDSMVGPDASQVPQHSEATIPRKYPGPFNRIAIGTGPGCELDPATGQCIGEPACWDYATIWPADRVMWHTYGYDGIVVVGGELYPESGACCNPDGTCAEVTSTECAGIFHGMNTLCADVVCCPLIYGDASRDGSVDMVDFAELQRCLTEGEGATAPSGSCTCFDFNGDDLVDASDVEHFASCANGPSVAGNSSPPCRGVGW